MPTDPDERRAPGLDSLAESVRGRLLEPIELSRRGSKPLTHQRIVVTRRKKVSFAPAPATLWNRRRLKLGQRSLAGLVHRVDRESVLGEIDLDVQNGHGFPFPSQRMRLQPHRGTSMPFAAAPSALCGKLWAGKVLSFVRMHTQCQQLLRLLGILMEPIESRSDIRSKLIAASPARVFDALRDPARVAKWWGPAGFTSTIHKYEFVPGGSWLLTMHGPDGMDYPNESRFTRIVADHIFEIEHLNGHHFVLTLELRPHALGTIVVWRQTFDTAEHCNRLAEFVAAANEQNLERLAAEVVLGDGAALSIAQAMGRAGSGSHRV